MKVYIIDLAAWSLVGLALVLGAYACWLFAAKVSPGLAHAIISAIH